MPPGGSRVAWLSPYPYPLGGGLRTEYSILRRRRKGPSARALRTFAAAHDGGKAVGPAHSADSCGSWGRFRGCFDGRAQGSKRMWRAPRPPASPSHHVRPALVVHVPDGEPLGPERLHEIDLHRG